MAKRKKVSELEEDARQIAALQAEASEGKRSPTRQLIPIRVVENVQLPSLSSDAIKRRLKGGGSRAGKIAGLEWFLVDYDESSALYEANCPYDFCHGQGTLMASTRIGKSGKAEMPFTDPGALCCDVCDLEIERLYEAEASKTRKSMAVSQ